MSFPEAKKHKRETTNGAPSPPNTPKNAALRCAFNAHANVNQILCMNVPGLPPAGKDPAAIRCRELLHGLILHIEEHARQ